MNSKPSPLTLRRYFPWFFLYAMACPMAFPITPAIISGLGIPDYMFGIAFAAMSFFSFLLAPFWGRLSDAYGRGPILTITVLGSAVGQTILCFCCNAPTLILARGVTGCFNGGHLINSMAYFAEASGGEMRNRNLALHVTCSTLFSALGYLVGGLLGDISHGYTFALQIGLLTLCGVTLLPLVGEPPRHKAAVTQAPSPLEAFRSARAFMNPALLVSLALTVTVTVGTNLFDEAYNYFLNKNLQFPPSYIGMVRAAMGLLGLAGYYLVCRRLLQSRRLAVSQAILYGLCALALAAVFCARGRADLLCFAIAFSLFNSIANSLLQVMVVGSAPPAQMGATAGLFQSSKTMGSVIGSLLSGFVYTIDNTLPFLAAAFLFGTATVVALAARFISVKQMDPSL